MYGKPERQIRSEVVANGEFIKLRPFEAGGRKGGGVIIMNRTTTVKPDRTDDNGIILQLQQ